MDWVNNLGEFEMVIMMERLSLTGFCAGLEWWYCFSAGGAAAAEVRGDLYCGGPGGGTVQRCTFSKHGCSAAFSREVPLRRAPCDARCTFSNTFFIWNKCLDIEVSHCWTHRLRSRKGGWLAAKRSNRVRRVSGVWNIQKKNPKQERILFLILFRGKGYPFWCLKKQDMILDIVLESQDSKIFIWISQKISMDIKRYPWILFQNILISNKCQFGYPLYLNEGIDI